MDSQPDPICPSCSPNERKYILIRNLVLLPTNFTLEFDFVATLLHELPIYMNHHHFYLLGTSSDGGDHNFFSLFFG